jgi:pimeloyl-ACP methyl ester carboxylesterase
VGDFDPIPYWRKVRAPVLAIFGGKDNIVPVEPNARILLGLIGSNPASEVVILPDDNHLGMLARTGLRAEYGRLDHIDPAYFDTIDDWLSRLR